MNVAIITRATYRSPRFLAEGLSNMLKKIGVKSTIYYQGLEQLELKNTTGSGLKIAAKSALAKYKIRQWQKYDVLIVSDTVGILAHNQLIATLRQFNKPVFLYEVFYPGGAQYWMDRLPTGALDLFDAYLTTSPINDITPKPTKPVYSIGINLDSDRVMDNKNSEFTALMDFPRAGYETERSLQIRALNDLNIKTITMDGEYSFDEISSIYSQSNIYFLAFPEAFGVPIAQLQNKGSYIASPKPDWVKRHALTSNQSTKSNISKTSFSSNFLFYDSYSELLDLLKKTRETYSSKEVIKRFTDIQPIYKYGDLKELKLALINHIQ